MSGGVRHPQQNLEKQMSTTETNGSDKPETEHAVRSIASFDDGLTRRAAMSASLGFLLLAF